MLTDAQCRAGRALLDWSRDDLARESSVGLRTIVDFERGAREPRRLTQEALRRALEAAGVEFIPENGGGAGVRLKYNRLDTRNIARFEGEGGTPGEDDVQ